MERTPDSGFSSSSERAAPAPSPESGGWGPGSSKSEKAGKGSADKPAVVRAVAAPVVAAETLRPAVGGNEAAYRQAEESARRDDKKESKKDAKSKGKGAVVVPLFPVVSGPDAGSESAVAAAKGAAEAADAVTAKAEKLGKAAQVDAAEKTDTADTSEKAEKTADVRPLTAEAEPADAAETRDTADAETDSDTKRDADADNDADGPDAKVIDMQEWQAERQRHAEGAVTLDGDGEIPLKEPASPEAAQTANDDTVEGSGDAADPVPDNVVALRPRDGRTEQAVDPVESSVPVIEHDEATADAEPADVVSLDERRQARAATEAPDMLADAEAAAPPAIDVEPAVPIESPPPVPPPFPEMYQTMPHDAPERPQEPAGDTIVEPVVMAQPDVPEGAGWDRSAADEAAWQRLFPNAVPFNPHEAAAAPEPGGGGGGGGGDGGGPEGPDGPGGGGGDGEGPERPGDGGDGGDRAAGSEGPTMDMPVPDREAAYNAAPFAMGGFNPNVIPGIPMVPTGFERSIKDVRNAAAVGLVLGYLLGRHGKRKGIRKAVAAARRDMEAKYKLAAAKRTAAAARPTPAGVAAAAANAAPAVAAANQAPPTATQAPAGANRAPATANQVPAAANLAPVTAAASAVESAGQPGPADRTPQRSAEAYAPAGSWAPERVPGTADLAATAAVVAGGALAAERLSGATGATAAERLTAATLASVREQAMPSTSWLRSESAMVGITGKTVESLSAKPLVEALAIPAAAVALKAAGERHRPGVSVEKPIPVLGAKSEKSMSKGDLLHMAKTIKVDGVPLRQVYNEKHIDEDGLRAVVETYLRGGDVSKQLQFEIVEKQKEFERDPLHRKQSRGQIREAISQAAGKAVEKTTEAAKTTQEAAVKAGKAVASGVSSGAQIAKDKIDSSTEGQHWAGIGAVAVIWAIIVWLLVSR